MSKKEEYVGELIRKAIKDKKVTNGFCIKQLIEAGIEMSDSKFSNKIYGERDKFNEKEIQIINFSLGTKF